jgi:hypothetical protein
MAVEESVLVEITGTGTTVAVITVGSADVVGRMSTDETVV